VRIVQGTPVGVWATVRGSITYNVALSLEGKELHMSCSCPYFADNGPCKHLWATILTAERQGHLGEVLPQRSVEVICDDDEEFYEDPPEDFDDEPDFEEDDKDDEGWSEPEPRRTVVYRPKKAKKPKAAKKPRPAEWSRVFSQIKQSLGRSGEQPGAAGWVEGKQLVYIIDVQSSLAQKGVVLDLAWQERKQNVDWSKPKFQAITQQQAEQIRTEPDAAIVALLFGAQKAQSYGSTYGYSYGSNSTRFVLSAAQRRSMLPLLGRSGRLLASLLAPASGPARRAARFLAGGLV